MPRVLTITAADKDTLARLAGQSGITGAVSGFVALEQEDECGWLLTGAAENGVRLLKAVAQGEAVLEGLIRAALFAAYGRGAAQACCPDPGLFPCWSALGLTATGERCGCRFRSFVTAPAGMRKRVHNFFAKLSNKTVVNRRILQYNKTNL